jgi:hypothetical protein
MLPISLKKSLLNFLDNNRLILSSDDYVKQVVLDEIELSINNEVNLNYEINSSIEDPDIKKYGLLKYIVSGFVVAEILMISFLVFRRLLKDIRA